ncbi:uncharacterized protein JN550_012604 [Neoarthrinium moseri]|uniref:uncharacterized protein n=1 Tax=Neoarthrinium moseri TaxID=1658444 RepID=UPI001FDE6A72|nr:uncharacterized protein JN550_012604 [Neoarthrinium moseri]KAI1858471.1 hypothetical protein JN550_012604 [Neoarthrinium moseri]
MVDIKAEDDQKPNGGLHHGLAQQGVTGHKPSEIAANDSGKRGREPKDANDDEMAMASTKIGDSSEPKRQKLGTTQKHVDNPENLAENAAGPVHDLSNNSQKTNAIDTIFVLPGNEVRFFCDIVAINAAKLAVKSKRLMMIPSEDEIEVAKRFRDLRAHLAYMGTNLDMTPKIRDRGKVKKTLDNILNETLYYFPEDVKAKARALRENWERENWGADEALDEEQQPASPTTAPDDEATTQVALPASNDPTFGVNGIMYGVLVVRGKGGRKVYQLNPEVPRASAQVFGQNGLTVGAWFPLQILALRNGAHGSQMGGIHGSLSKGAYSVVVTDLYHDLDRDEGDILYYSGSNSHDNENRDRPAESSAGTKALKASLASGRPVRVLRSGGSTLTKTKSSFAPSCGIRYDGLYRVVQKLTPINKKGGMYEQFKLMRLPGQPSLADIRKRSPTRQQIEALEEFQKRD